MPLNSVIFCLKNLKSLGILTKGCAWFVSYYPATGLI